MTSVRTLLVGLLVAAAAAVAAAPLAIADRGSGSTSTTQGAATTPTPTTTTTTAVPAAPTTAAPAPGEDDPTSAVPGGTVATPGAPAAEDAPAANPTVSLDTDAPGPALGRAFGLAQASGKVFVRTRDGRAAQALDAAAAIPVGARIDARHGTAQLAAAVDAAGTTQVGTFSGGVFEVEQTPGGLTQIVLVGGSFRGCGARTAAARAGARTAVAVAAKARKRGKPVRRLWGADDHGRFQSRGRGSVATVRGTRWLTEDYCDGTLTRVAAGAVAVRDLAKHKTVLVKAGHSYFARTKR